MVELPPPRFADAAEKVAESKTRITELTAQMNTMIAKKVGPTTTLEDVYAAYPDIEKEIDEEISEILTAKYDEARQLLLDHRAALDAIAIALLERETLERSELEALLRGEGLPEMQVDGGREAATRGDSAAGPDVAGATGGRIPDPDPDPEPMPS